MKKITLLSIFLLTSLLLTTNITFSAGFNGITSPDGVNVIAVGEGGSIFRSANGGQTWASYTMSSVSFKSVCSYNDDVWIAGDNGKIYKTKKVNSIINPIDVGTIFVVRSIHFVDNNMGFLCGDNGNVYRTNNGGNSWTICNTGLPAVRLTAISFMDWNNGIVAGDNGTVYKTINGGDSWTMEATGLTTNLTSAKYFADGMAVAGEWGSLAMKNGSSPWTVVNTKTVSDIRSISGTSINDVHIAGGGGFIRNNKAGNIGFLNFEVNPMLADLVAVSFFNNEIGYAVSSLNNAIIKTSNGGTSWELTAGATRIMSWENKPGASGNSLGDPLCVHPYNRNTIFTNFSGQTYVSRNRGESWAAVGTNSGFGNRPHSFYVSPADTNVWLCAIESNPTDKVIRTTNYGQTWSVIVEKNFSNYGEPLEMDQNSGSTFYFGPDNGGFWRSTDNGASFTEISGNYPFRSPCDIMVAYDLPNTIFLADGITGSGLGDLYKSVNGGLNWTRVFTNPSSSEIPSMSNTQFDNKLAFLTNWPGGDIYKTVNTGDNWSLNHTNGFSGWGSDICSEDPNLIITGSWSGGSTGISLDGGQTWTSLSGLSGSGGVMKVVERGYVVAQAGSSVYKLKVSYDVVTSVNENIISTVPGSFDLSQNYPNPFNPTTNIKFDLPKDGNISLKVFNQLGEEVETLSSGFKTAGSYEINFNASALSSGVYFYKLTGDGISITKKMLLIK